MLKEICSSKELGRVHMTVSRDTVLRHVIRSCTVCYFPFPRHLLPWIEGSGRPGTGISWWQLFVGSDTWAPIFPPQPLYALGTRGRLAGTILS